MRAHVRLTALYANTYRWHFCFFLIFNSIKKNKIKYRKKNQSNQKNNCACWSGSIVFLEAADAQSGHQLSSRKHINVRWIQRPACPLPSLSLFTHGSPDRVAFDPDGLKTEQKYTHTIKIKYKIKGKKIRNLGGLIIPKSTGLFLINLDDVFVLHPQLTKHTAEDRLVRECSKLMELMEKHLCPITVTADFRCCFVWLFYSTDKCKTVGALYERSTSIYLIHHVRQKDEWMLKSKRDKCTSFGVWLSAILCPSNRNLSVLAATPCKKHTNEILASELTLQAQNEILKQLVFRVSLTAGIQTCALTPVSGCKTPSASSDVSSFSP